MDRVDELAAFVAILDAGSLAGAARQLRRSPPWVTRALAGLEARLGTRLLERSTRRLAPTEAGRQLGVSARQALAAVADALSAGADANPAGLIRITAPLIFGRRHVMPIIAGFLAAHLATQAELALSDRYLDLVEEGFDVALRIGPAIGNLPPPHRVGTVRRIVVASPAYLASRGEPQAPSDLARHAVVHVVGRPVPAEWRFRAGRHERVVRLSPRLTVNEIEAALVAVRAGHGFARVLSYQVAEELAAGTLVRVLDDYEPPALAVSLVAAAANPPARVRAFLDYAIPALAQLPVIQPEDRGRVPA